MIGCMFCGASGEANTGIRRSAPVIRSPVRSPGPLGATEHVSSGRSLTDAFTLNRTSGGRTRRHAFLFRDLDNPAHVRRG